MLGNVDVYVFPQMMNDAEKEDEKKEEEEKDRMRQELHNLDVNEGDLDDLSKYGNNSYIFGSKLQISGPLFTYSLSSTCSNQCSIPAPTQPRGNTTGPTTTGRTTTRTTPTRPSPSGRTVRVRRRRTCQSMIPRTG